MQQVEDEEQFKEIQMFLDIRLLASIVRRRLSILLKIDILRIITHL